MGRLHFRPVTFEELAERASVIVLARLATPPRREESVAIAGRTRSGSRPRPFALVLTRLQVTEVLRGAPGLIGQVLEVESANARAMLRMHTDYELKGLSRSPIFDAYEGVPLDAEQERLVFLHEAGRRFAFVVDSAVEDRARRTDLPRR
ncbi:MAG: hypothetical protein ACOZQL_20710 [Myxococcota bacterium]